MLEIGRVFESALRTNSEELRRAAKATVRRMGPDTSIQELMDCDAAPELRKLSLGELCQAAGLGTTRREVRSSDSAPVGARDVVAAEASNEELLYRRMVEVMGDGEPRTIGQLAKGVGMTPDTLRPFIAWMREMGKIEVTGRARSTRYRLR